MTYKLKFKKLPREVRRLKLIKSRAAYPLNKANALFEKVTEKLKESDIELDKEIRIEISSEDTKEVYEFNFSIDVTKSLAELVSLDIFKAMRGKEEREVGELEDIENALTLEFEQALSRTSDEVTEEIIDPPKEHVSESEMETNNEDDEYVPDYMVQDDEKEQGIVDSVEPSSSLQKNDEVQAQHQNHKSKPVEVLGKKQIDDIQFSEYLDISKTKSIKDLDKIILELTNKVILDVEYMLQKLKLNQVDDFISQKKKEFVESYYSTADLEKLIASVKENGSILNQKAIKSLDEKYNEIKKIDKEQLIGEKIQSFKNEKEATFNEKSNETLNRLAKESLAEEQLLEARQKEEREALEQRHTREKLALENKNKGAIAKAKEDMVTEFEKTLSSGIEEIKQKELDAITIDHNEKLIRHKYETVEKLNLASSKIIQQAHELEKEYINEFLTKLGNEQENFDNAYESHKVELEKKQKQEARQMSLEIAREKNEVSKKQLEREVELDQKAEEQIHHFANMYQKASYECESQRLENLQFQNQMLEHWSRGNAHTSNSSKEEKKSNTVSKIALGAVSALAIAGIGGSLAYNHVQAQGQGYSESYQILLEKNAELESKLDEYIFNANTKETSNKVLTYEEYVSEGNYEEAVEQYPDQANNLEQYLFKIEDEKALEMLVNNHNTIYGKLDLAILKGQYEVITSEYEVLSDDDKKSLRNTQKNGIALAYIEQKNMKQAEQVIK